jgi:hypothetical protein
MIAGTTATAMAVLDATVNVALASIARALDVCAAATIRVAYGYLPGAAMPLTG